MTRRLLFLLLLCLLLLCLAACRETEGDEPVAVRVAGVALDEAAESPVVIL